MDIVAARHAAIAARYAAKKREREPVSLAALRVAELRRLYHSRYGHALSDDDAGRDDARLMLHHIARRPDAERRMSSWMTLWAPWMPPDEMAALIQTVLAKPLRWKADRLAKRLGLHESERNRLRITTIGAVDLDRKERLAKRKAKGRQREEARRRAVGAKPRHEYEADSVTKRRPWEALGMSRRSWYRAGKPKSGTSP
jgi:hypothetical protein